MIREWRVMDPRQPFVMLQILSDRTQCADHLALAALAFHQSLRAEAEAARLGSGKDLAQARKRQEIAADLKNSAQSELNAAVQGDLSLRERQSAERALLQRLAELLANPPAPRD
jgi:hypothetical protein